MLVASNILELIGRTPLVRINNIGGKKRAELYAKLEWYNIGQSVKDRMALYLIEYAECSGKLDKDKIILEASSGNTGIALAMIAAMKGYKTCIIMPESVSIERRKIIKAYGSQLILSPAEKGTWGAIEMKEKMLSEEPEKYINIDQFKEPANIMAHYHTTGREILEQMNWNVDVIVVGIGTAGTGVGVSMRVKEYKEDIKIVGVIPELGNSIQGLRNPDEPYPTQLYRKKWFDEVVEIKKEDMNESFEIARALARNEGLLVGMSSATIMLVALKKAHEIKNGRIVAVLPDSGMKYLSTHLFEG